ncbi:MAG: DUF3098 domain-containing protein [Bacteroidales bacterium]|nr:DUF3098 domain-containing protein [Bacteroidales bacterium]
MAQKTIPKKESNGFAIPRENYRYLLIGFAIIVLGFILMSGGKTDNPNEFHADQIFSFRRITLAPIMVLIGFAFEIWAIMRIPRETSEEN